jgi:hypothetical protein|eukprot:scaffold2153_cov271-Chaetoceros_neogracile.AAC.18
MNRLTYIFAVLATILISTNAFAPSTSFTVSSKTANAPVSKTTVFLGLGPDDESKRMTRENEPDEYFSSKMDDMSDSEKLPIALGGLAFISLPFIFGLIALYSSK